MGRRMRQTKLTILRQTMDLSTITGPWANDSRFRWNTLCGHQEKENNIERRVLMSILVSYLVPLHWPLSVNFYSQLDFLLLRCVIEYRLQTCPDTRFLLWQMPFSNIHNNFLYYFQRTNRGRSGEPLTKKEYKIDEENNKGRFNSQYKYCWFSSMAKAEI
jgi:hypothetical protein